MVTEVCLSWFGGSFQLQENSSIRYPNVELNVTSTIRPTEYCRSNVDKQMDLTERKCTLEKTVKTKSRVYL